MKTHLTKSVMRRRKVKCVQIILLLIFGTNYLSYSAENDNGWILNKSVGKVNSYYKIVTCNNKDFVLLKFENLNDHAVSISWTESFKVKESGDRIKHDQPKELKLIPGITSQEDCENITNKSCSITIFEIAPAYHPHVIDYAFETLEVK